MSQVEFDSTNSNVEKKISPRNDQMDDILDEVFNIEEQSDIDEKYHIVNEMKGYEANAKLDKVELDPLGFWRSSHELYPRLSLVARYVFNPNAASTESKRIFRKDGHIRRKRRARLTGVTTNKLVVGNGYLKRNYNL